MARVNLNLRNTRSREETPINIVIRWNRERLVYPSGARIKPRLWSTSAQEAKSGLEGYGTFNGNLSDRMNRVRAVYLRFLLANEQRQPTKEELRQCVAAELDDQPSDKVDKLTLFDFIDAHIEGARVRMDAGELSGASTLSKYRTTRDHLRSFCKAQKVVLDWDTVDRNLYLRFMTYLTKDKGMATNTVGKYIRTLKTFLNAAQDEKPGLMPKYRSRKFVAPADNDTGKVYLTDRELTELFHLDLSHNKRLEQVRDMFIVGAWTGLRYSDWGSVTPEQVTGDRIRIGTAKTKEKVTIPVHACVRAILIKYDNVLPRIISNQKMNRYLKEVVTLLPSLQEPVTICRTVAGAEVRETKSKAEWVSTHTARRSFATNAYRGDGYVQPVPVRVIMAITGHRTEKAFQVYIRMKADDHADEFAKYMDKVAPLAIAI